MNALTNKLMKTALTLALFVEIIIILCALCGMIQKEGWVLLTVVPAIGIIIIIATKTPSIPESIYLSRIYKSKIVWAVLQVAALIAMFQVAIRIVPNFSWDWGRIVQDATSYALGGEIDDISYYARYPNNQFWFGALTAYFQLCISLNPLANGAFLLNASIFLSCLMIQISIAFVRLAAITVWGEGRRAFSIWFACFMFVPFWLYSPFAYSDAPAVLTCATMILLYLRAKRYSANGSRMLFIACCCLLGIMAALAWKIKVMLLIVVFAMVVATLLQRCKFKSFAYAATCFTACFIATALIGSLFSSMYIQISAKEADAYEFPPVHWVMMSMAYGGYVGDDVAFTKSFPTKQERAEADMGELKRRLAERGVIGSIQHLAITKAVRQYGESTLAGSDYVSRNPTRPRSIFQRLLGINGDLHWLLLPYTWTWHIAMLIGIAAGTLVMLLQGESHNLLFASITILGIYLFFSIWECNPRYLVPFTPILILSSISGWIMLRDLFRTHVSENPRQEAF